jgi:tRNA (mo5U34)-methyltransferase
MAWDWPVGATPEAVEALERRKAGGVGFELVGSLLGKQARRSECSVYDLDPAEHGKFDFVYLGSLLLHLRDPVRALEAVRSVCDGQLLVFDAVDLWLTLTRPRSPVARFDGRGRPWWWKPNTTGLVRLVESAGFELVQPPVRTWIPPGAGHLRPPLSLSTLRHREGREYLVSSRRGDPHVAVLARPVR